MTKIRIYHTDKPPEDLTDLEVDNLRVGTGVTIYGNVGIVSAIAFYGDGSTNALSVYDTAPLRETLERLIDFDLINNFFQAYLPFA